ncbi:MAG: hypothetical protein JWQ74_3624 [Marmoricola sp.]|nr:hypothetical protein [Marmoricola sp.]
MRGGEVILKIRFGQVVSVLLGRGRGGVSIDKDVVNVDYNSAIKLF